MSGVGKSTLANNARVQLENMGYVVLTIDGDAVRATTSRDLGFTKSDISENNRRIISACVRARKEADAILIPVIAPFKAMREAARNALNPGYNEIYLSTPINILRKRDVKGLYAKEARGEINNLIGVSAGSPYEVPQSPDLRINTSEETPDSSTERLVRFVSEQLGMRNKTEYKK